ncbi:hypothetical protein FS749_016430 [Ceratobasidium sp. UAMH 11750]|nr:hypothetical protein FS749_016430 [Ceratobasidium sp. UAMH 11750]
MSRVVPEYRRVFRLTTLQRGRPTALALSPSGRWLCSTTDNGDLMVLRSLHGRIYFHVGMGRQNYATAVTWATDWQIIVGCANGALYIATLTTNPSPEEKVVKFTNLLHEEDSSIRALAYDFDSKLLALGYSYQISIWRRVVDEYPQVWETVDVFPIDNSPGSGRVLSLCFFGVRKKLLVGLEAGTIVWSPDGKTRTNTSIDTHRIGAATLSSDNSTMAISTRGQSVLICPFLPEGPMLSLAHTYLLESGREWSRFESRTPVALTPDCRVVCGTLDGTVAILSHNGSCLQKLENGGLCARQITTHKHMIYVAFTAAIDAITIIGYSNGKGQKPLPHDEEVPPQERDIHFYRFHQVYS